MKTFKKGDSVVCFKTNGTPLDNKIIYEVSGTSANKYITVYGHTEMFKIKRFKHLNDFRKDLLIYLLCDLKINKLNSNFIGIKKHT